MENLTLGNFKQGMKSELRRVVKDHLLSMYPSPINVLETIDDISLDWTDDGGEFSAKFINIQGYTVLNSEFSKGGERILPLLDTLTNFDQYLSEDGYNLGYFVIEISNSNLKRGYEYWNSIVSQIILRLSNEYIVECFPDNIFNRKRKNAIGTVTYTARTYGGDTTITMPIDDLKKELAKIVNMKFAFRVLKPQT